MNKINGFRKSEKGQASSEFAIIMPFIVCFYLIMVVAGLTWHGYHLNAQMALEGASKEGVSAGSGVGRVFQLTSNWMPGYQISAVASSGKYPYSAITGDYVQVITQGITPAWSILGMRAGVGHTMSSAVSPVWEFVP